MTGIDIDYASPRGISLRDAVARHLAKCTPAPGGCLIGPHGPKRYHEVRASGLRVGAHVAVALVRGDDIPDGHVVRHRCDTPGCSASEHLLVGTQSQNVADEYARARRTTGWARGEGRPNAVMTELDVIAMRRSAREGASLPDLVAQFGFPYSPTRMAVRGESWSHVTAEAPVPGRRNSLPNPLAYRFTRFDEAVRARELSDKGLSLREIAKELGVSRSTAWKLVQVAREAVSA